MTERLAEITRRIENVRQLEAVVTAMRGIAARRAQQSRAQLPAVRAYAAVIAGAIAAALPLLPEVPPAARRASRGAVILFGAEQGFAGAFSDRMLDAAAPLLAGASLFLIGTRAIMLAGERRLAIAWQSGMAPHIDAVPAVAGRVADALYERVAASAFDRVSLVFPVWSAASGLGAERRVLLPFEFGRITGPPRSAQAPLVTLPADVLLSRLAEEYVFAELCEAAMLAFAAENEARVAAMMAAKGNIERVRTGLDAEERQTRQEEITAEVAELAGAMAAG
ncbi:MAG: F0F1 ATP synthase subunit gamma [Rhodospirillales bacterium]|nr:F0F1 ATP synthase subunit gamma [Rhodospirillales bacterium]